MSHIFVRPENVVGNTFVLDEKESHHVSKVLRIKSGETVSLFDGEGGQFEGQLTTVTPTKVKGTILQKLATKSKATFVTLFQGLPKGSKLDYVIEKAVELGVDRVVPFTSKKNPVHVDDLSEAKKSRYERVAEAAAKQCDRPSIPKIGELRKLDGLASDVQEGMSLVFVLDKSAARLRDVLAPIAGIPPQKINLFIGPESGFSEDETAWLTAHGAKLVSLGNFTFRTETAGLVALALVNYELGNL